MYKYLNLVIIIITRIYVILFYWLLIIEYSYDNFTMENFTNFFNLNREIISPLNQFEIRDILSLDAPILGNIHLSITNIGLYLMIGLFFILALNLLSTNYNKLVGNNWSISQESLYATIHSIVTNQINPKSGQVYFP